MPGAAALPPSGIVNVAAATVSAADAAKLSSTFPAFASHVPDSEFLGGRVGLVEPGVRADVLSQQVEVEAGSQQGEARGCLLNFLSLKPPASHPDPYGEKFPNCRKDVQMLGKGRKLASVPQSRSYCYPHLQMRCPDISCRCVMTVVIPHLRICIRQRKK